MVGVGEKISLARWDGRGDGTLNRRAGFGVGSGDGCLVMVLGDGAGWSRMRGFVFGRGLVGPCRGKGGSLERVEMGGSEMVDCGCRIRGLGLYFIGGLGVSEAGRKRRMAVDVYIFKVLESLSWSSSYLSELSGR